MFIPDAHFTNLEPVTLPASIYDLEREERLTTRYSRKAPAPLAFEFTRDPGLLHQYYKIRENEFNNVLGLTNYSGVENEHDKTAHILVIKSGSFCVGGIRLHVKTPRNPKPLPVEIKGFSLEKYFPHLSYKPVSYGQISVLAVLPEFRGAGITRAIFQRVISKAEALNLRYLFGACPPLNARLYRHDFKAMGLTDTTIHYDIELPTIISPRTWLFRAFRARMSGLIC